MGRPLPLHAKLEMELGNLKREERLADLDGYRDANERARIAAVQSVVNVYAALLVKTTRFLATIVSGEQGIDSPKAREVWEGRQADRLYEEFREELAPVREIPA